MDVILVSSNIFIGTIRFLGEPYSASVYSEAPPGVTVITVTACYAVQLDGACKEASVTYFLNGQDSVFFSISPINGQIQTAQPIEKAVGDTYLFYVVVATSGESDFRPITVIVTERNTRNPMFERSRYEVYVYVASTPGTYATTVKAVDPDDPEIPVKYSVNVEKSVYSKAISVDEKSGRVSTASLPEVQTFDVTVTATDHGSPPASTDVKLYVTLTDLSGKYQPMLNTSK